MRGGTGGGGILRTCDEEEKYGEQGSHPQRNTFTGGENGRCTDRGGRFKRILDLKEQKKLAYGGVQTCGSNGTKF